MQNKDKSRTEIKSVELLLYCKNNPNGSLNIVVFAPKTRGRAENPRVLSYLHEIISRSIISY
jgi:hypothetical protein